MVPVPPFGRAFATAALLLLVLAPAVAPTTGSGDGDPDLALVGIDLSSEVPEPGEVTTFVARVQNLGSAPAQGFRIVFEVDGVVLSEVEDRWGLAPGAEQGWHSSNWPDWAVAAGPHVVRVLVDPADKVVETDEGNNVLERRFEARVHTGVVDLVANGVMPSDGILRFSAGDLVTFSARIENHGNDTANHFRFRCSIGDWSLDGGVNPIDVAPGQGWWTTCQPWRAVAGHHLLHIVLDPLDEHRESDETNNALDFRFFVGDRPDLVLDAAWPPPGLGPEAPAPLQALVRNNGTVAAGPFLVQFRLDGELLGFVEVAELPAGLSTQVSVETRVPLGTHLLEVIADVKEVIEEAWEDNNVARREIRSTVPPAHGEVRPAPPPAAEPPPVSRPTPPPPTRERFEPPPPAREPPPLACPVPPSEARELVPLACRFVDRQAAWPDEVMVLLCLADGRPPTSA